MPSIDLKGQSNPKNRRKMIFKKIKLSSVAVYAGIFLFVVAMIYVGYEEPQEISISNTKSVNVLALTNQISVDDVIATGVAANVAQTVNLPISTSISNLAVSTQIKSEITQLNGVDSNKPQIIETASVNRSIMNYTVVAGDTAVSLAEKFQISSQTIKWANKLTSDSLTEGKVLSILPVNGVLYKVKSGDTIDSISDKYKVDKTRLVLYNDLEIGGLVVDSSIILPEGDLPEVERPGYVAPYVYSYRVAYGFSGGDVSYLSIPRYGDYYAMNDTLRSYLPGVGNLLDSSSGNSMYQGQCTWWAWERRLAIGRPLPSGALGNASDWAYNLGKNYNYKVDSTPRIGAVFQNNGGAGHVGIVESINYNSNGGIISFVTSEMNYPYRAYQVVSRTIPASNIGDFNFIH